MSKKEYTVLYVDDEIINLKLFNSLFKRNFNVFTCLSGKEALELLKTEDVDVIITDQRMPEMTGVEFLKEVNDIYPEIPPQRLMLSGFSPKADVDKAYNEYNLFKFISKPWNYKELNEIILSAIVEKKAT